MPLIPHLIPPVDPLPTFPLPTSAGAILGTYDVAIGGLGFRYVTDPTKQAVWETAPYLRPQVDQAAEPGEQTLTNWWVKSQASFHGGAGQLNLERTDLPPAYTHIRFQQSKNVDVWTPGIVQRLPDTTVISASTTSALVPFALAGADRAAYIDGTTPKMITTAGAATTFTGVTEAAYALDSDGSRVFVAGLSGVWVVDPAAPTLAVKVATYPATSTTPVLGWVKARLMCGVNGAVYEVDTNPGAPPVALGAGTGLVYTHPTAGWRWRCFSEAPSAILAAGDAGSFSSIVEFALASDGSTPVLVVAATAAELPPGERVLAMRSTMGTFLGIGTSAGLRVGQFNDALSDTRLNYGPLTLPTSETQFAVQSITARDRFLYAAGLAVDEPGLVRVDLGTQTDQAGRFAYATDLIAPTQQAAAVVTAVCTLPSGKLLFSAPASGLCLEGTGPGSVRDAWLTTSRLRYNTTEPKLFKLGRVRGVFTAPSAVRVEGITRTDSFTLATIGATSDEPDEFGLPAGRFEWLQLKFTLSGASTQLGSYGVKALPGTPRPRRIQVWLQCADKESDRRGRTSTSDAYTRAAALFELDRAGDEVFFEEYGSKGNRKTLVQIEQARFEQDVRPTDRSDTGGVIMVLMRTVT